jgi:hypothetical protein
MTPLADKRGTLADTRWQTLAMAAGSVVLTAGVGRWTAGATFGYVLFVLLWAPIAACLVSPARQPWSGIAAVVGTASLLVLPCLQWESLAAVERLTLILACTGLAVIAVRCVLNGLFGSATAAAVAVVLWLAWLVLPVTCPACFDTLIGETVTARLLAVHPLLTANAVAETAGDWTHQAIAYKWLTRLGQDVPMAWPASVGPCVLIHLAVAIIGGFVAWGLNATCSTWNNPPRLGTDLPHTT